MKEIEISVLKDIIQVNNERNQGYGRAIEELLSDDEDLKTVFAGMSQQSANYQAVLAQELQALEDHENEFTGSGKISQTCIDPEVAFSGHDRQSVLNNCELGEEVVKKAYEMALDTEGLSLAVQSILETQQTELRAAHNHMVELKNSIA